MTTPPDKTQATEVAREWLKAWGGTATLLPGAVVSLAALIERERASSHPTAAQAGEQTAVMPPGGFRQCEICGAGINEVCVFPVGRDYAGERLEGVCRDGQWDHRAEPHPTPAPPIPAGMLDEIEKRVAEEQAYLANRGPDFSVVTYRDRFGVEAINDRRTLLALLRAHTPVQGEWQSIESAPKYENEGDVPVEFIVLLYDGDQERTYLIQMGFWNNIYNGWQSCDEHGGTPHPTHWQPLPAPPSPSQVQGKDTA